MKQYNIVDIFDKLVGKYTFCGSHEVDMERLETLKNVEKILYGIIENLIKNAEQRNHCVASIAQIGKESYDILMECWYQIDQLRR